MRVMILGAGGVGGYIGAQLLRHSDAEVAFVAREEHLEAIQKNGLRIVEDNDRYTVHPSHATDEPSSLGHFDLILVTVKSTSLEESLKSIESNVTARTVLLPLLNGVDHDRTILRHYPDADVLTGCIYILSNILEPGVIRKKGKVFKLCWGKRNFEPERYTAISRLFDEAQLLHEAGSDIEEKVWRKFLFISPMAALTSRYKKSMREIAEEHARELETLLDELLAVAQARGISLSQSDLVKTLERARKVLPKAKTSMQLDLERSKPAEIETLVGHIAEEAKHLGLETPHYTTLYKILKHEAKSQ